MSLSLHNNVNRKRPYRLSDTVTESNTGLMVLITKGTGVTTKQKDKGLSGMLKVMFIEAILEMIWQMVTVNTHISTAQNIKESLEMMYKKDTVKKNGSMVLNMSEAIRME